MPLVHHIHLISIHIYPPQILWLWLSSSNCLNQDLPPCLGPRRETRRSKSNLTNQKGQLLHPCTGKVNPIKNAELMIRSRAKNNGPAVTLTSKAISFSSWLQQSCHPRPPPALLLTIDLTRTITFLLQERSLSFASQRAFTGPALT